MLHVEPILRMSISEFRAKLYAYIKENKLRYSDQRERILKLLHTQDEALDVDSITRKLNAQKIKSASYATVLRQMQFFDDLGFVHVSDKREYLLKERI